MKAQVYRVPVAQEQLVDAEPGQYVFPGDESNEIVGFISQVIAEKSEIEICMFESTDLDVDNMSVVHESITAEKLREYLFNVFKVNPKAQAAWQDLMAAWAG